MVSAHPVIRTWSFDSIYDTSERIDFWLDGMEGDSLNTEGDSSVYWIRHLNLYTIVAVETANGNLPLGFNDRLVLHGDLSATNTGTGLLMLGTGYGTGRLVLLGEGDQWVMPADGDDVLCRRLVIDKPNGRVKLTDTLEVSHRVYFEKGVLECVDEGVLSFQDGSVAGTVSDSSYVEGPVQKIGDDAFTFPVGRNGHYRPIEISAPTKADASFTALYLNADSDSLYDHGSKESSINEVSTNEYWLLDRAVGSDVSVTLSWDDMSCGFDTLANVRMVAWDGIAKEWKDLGNGGTTGDTDEGTIVSGSASTVYGAYALATVDTFDCVPCRADAGEDMVSWPSLPSEIGTTQIGGYSYLWSPSTDLNDHEVATPEASPLTTTVYKVSTTNTEECIASDNVQVEIIPRPEMPPCLH